jgi:hypothetical protein
MADHQALGTFQGGAARRHFMSMMDKVARPHIRLRRNMQTSTTVAEAAATVSAKSETTNNNKKTNTVKVKVNEQAYSYVETSHCSL